MLSHEAFRKLGSRRRGNSNRGGGRTAPSVHEGSQSAPPRQSSPPRPSPDKGKEAVGPSVPLNITRVSYRDLRSGEYVIVPGSPLPSPVRQRVSAEEAASLVGASEKRQRAPSPFQPRWRISDDDSPMEVCSTSREYVRCVRTPKDRSVVRELNDSDLAFKFAQALSVNIGMGGEILERFERKTVELNRGVERENALKEELAKAKEEVESLRKANADLDSRYSKASEEFSKAEAARSSTEKNLEAALKELEKVREDYARCKDVREHPEFEEAVTEYGFPSYQMGGRLVRDWVNAQWPELNICDVMAAKLDFDFGDVPSIPMDASPTPVDVPLEEAREGAFLGGTEDLPPAPTLED